MPAKMSAQLQRVQHTKAAGVLREDRAHARARRATRGIRSQKLAEHFGVAPATARSMRTRVKGPLSNVLALVSDPTVDAGPIVAALLLAWEERFVFEPTADLRARLAHLKYEAEHAAEARQNRALQTPTTKDVGDVISHASILLEIALLESLVGEEKAH